MKENASRYRPNNICVQVDIDQITFLFLLLSTLVEVLCFLTRWAVAWGMSRFLNCVRLPTIAFVPMTFL